MSHSIGEPISLNQVIEPNNSLTSTNNSCSSIIIKLSVQGNLKSQIKLTGEVVSELNWWIHNLQLSKGEAITALPFSSVVTSDGELVLSQQRYPIDLLRKEGAYKCFWGESSQIRNFNLFASLSRYYCPFISNENRRNLEQKSLTTEQKILELSDREGSLWL